MIRRTLKDVRPELARLASVSGISASDPRIFGFVNSATEELMNEGDWPGVVDRYLFRAYGGNVTLPADLDRIMAVAVDGVPVEMRSPWFEFVQGGPGVQDGHSWVDVALDRGEVCTFASVPKDGRLYRLVLIGEVDERVDGVRPSIMVNGYNNDGQWMRSVVGGEHVNGIQLSINGDTVPKQIVSTGYVDEVESVIKPVTRGFIHLFADSGETTHQLATYAPRETNPSYRRYFIPNLPVDSVSSVLVRARRRFMPVTHENDFLIISNMPALAWMMKAIAKRDADKIEEYVACKALATAILTKESTSYHGKAINPAITFTRGFGFGSVPYVV